MEGPEQRRRSAGAGGGPDLSAHPRASADDVRSAHRDTFGASLISDNKPAKCIESPIEINLTSKHTETIAKSPKTTASRDHENAQSRRRRAAWNAGPSQASLAGTNGTPGAVRPVAPRGRGGRRRHADVRSPARRQRSRRCKNGPALVPAPPRRHANPQPEDGAPRPRAAHLVARADHAARPR
jgi:hypothetical protein